MSFKNIENLIDSIYFYICSFDDDANMSLTVGGMMWNLCEIVKSRQ